MTAAAGSEEPTPPACSVIQNLADAQYYLDDASAAHALWTLGDVPSETDAIASLRDVITAAEAAIEQIREDAMSIRTAQREMDQRAFEQIIAAWSR